MSKRENKKNNPPKTAKFRMADVKEQLERVWKTFGILEIALTGKGIVTQREFQSLVTTGRLPIKEKFYVRIWKKFYKATCKAFKSIFGKKQKQAEPKKGV